MNTLRITCETSQQIEQPRARQIAERALNRPSRRGAGKSLARKSKLVPLILDLILRNNNYKSDNKIVNKTAERKKFP